MESTPAQWFYRSKKSSRAISRDGEYLAAYFSRLCKTRRTRIIYAVTNIISARDHISHFPVSCFAEVSLLLHRSHCQSRTCCIIVPTRRKISRSSILNGVMALLSDSFPFTVRRVFTSASLRIHFSRCAQP